MCPVLLSSPVLGRGDVLEKMALGGCHGDVLRIAAACRSVMQDLGDANLKGIIPS
jgi:hypothetical protein